MDDNLEFFKQFIESFASFKKEMKEDFDKLVPLMKKQEEELTAVGRKHMEELGELRDQIKTEQVRRLVDKQLMDTYSSLIELEKSSKQMQENYNRILEEE